MKLLEHDRSVCTTVVIKLRSNCVKLENKVQGKYLFFSEISVSVAEEN
jgi:hypothetical protein